MTLMRPPPPHGETSRLTRALTRRNLSNEIYTRLPEVEEQIERMLALDRRALVEVAGQNYESPAHVKDETLCYFIRESLYEGAGRSAQELAEVLLKRHAGTLRRRVSSGVEARHAEDCASEITLEMLTQLFDVETDRSDFAQVRFGLFLERLSNNVVNKFRKLQQIERQASSVTASHNGEAAEEIDIFDTLADEHALSAEDRTVARHALAHLPKDLREIFILRHFAGWQIESDSAAEPSISRHLNVTPRTVHNRLKQAEASLARWRKGKRFEGNMR